MMLRYLGAIMDQGEGHPRVKNRNKIFLNDIFTGNFMRKIDCAHSRSVKNFVSPLKLKNTLFLPIFSHLKIRIFQFLRVEQRFSRFGNDRNQFFA
jgi:hypothetical protein